MTILRPVLIEDIKNIELRPPINVRFTTEEHIRMYNIFIPAILILMVPLSFPKNFYIEKRTDVVFGPFNFYILEKKERDCNTNPLEFICIEIQHSNKILLSVLHMFFINFISFILHDFGIIKMVYLTISIILTGMIVLNLHNAYENGQQTFPQYIQLIVLLLYCACDIIYTLSIIVNYIIDRV